MQFKIAAPDEYLAITGMHVKTVRITKAAWIWPFQRCTRFSVRPRDYEMSLQAMTQEKLQLLLPVVFTIGPDVNARCGNAKDFPKPGDFPKPIDAQQNADAQEGASQDQSVETSHAHDEDRGDSLMKYAMLLAEAHAQKNGVGVDHLGNIVKGIIEGETRVLVSSMNMDQIFGAREVFKRRIFQNIQKELNQFGLKIYNANIKELNDAEGSTYFHSLSQRAHEGAINQARIDVADARLRGTIGEAQLHGEQDRKLAKINAETAVQKTDRDVERARAEAHLATQKATLNREVEIAQIEATRATESRDEDLKREVQVKRAGAELERLRATDVVKATIDRESKEQDADAKAYELEADARANFQKSTKAADAAAYKTRLDADAQSHAAQKNADAALQTRLKEAEGMKAMAEAYGKMSQAFGGPQGLLQYMMIEKGTYVELAKANGAAVHGMQPKISVWNTGAEAGAGTGGDGGHGPAATMRNVYQLLPPLMSTIHDQTGITLPEWQFGRLPNNGAAQEHQSKNHMVNGK